MNRVLCKQTTASLRFSTANRAYREPSDWFHVRFDRDLALKCWFIMKLLLGTHQIAVKISPNVTPSKRLPSSCFKLVREILKTKQNMLILHETWWTPQGFQRRLVRRLLKGQGWVVDQPEPNLFSSNISIHTDSFEKWMYFRRIERSARKNKFKTRSSWCDPAVSLPRSVRGTKP